MLPGPYSQVTICLGALRNVNPVIRYDFTLSPLKLSMRITGPAVTSTIVWSAPAPRNVIPLRLVSMMRLPHEYDPASKLTTASSNALLTAVWTWATVLPAVQVKVRAEPEHVASAFDAKIMPTLPHKILLSRCAVTIFRLLAAGLM